MQTKSKWYGLRSGLCACLLFAAVSSSAAAAPSPLSVIQTGTDQMLQILESSRGAGAASVRDRRGEILTILDKYFNFEEMGKRALGRPWKDQAPEKQKEFVRLFKQLLFNTYVDKVEGYTGSKEKIVYMNDKIEGSYALVKTKITGYKNADVLVDYRLRLEGDSWRVYDVIVEGISLVDNYREQFSSILANGSFDSLLMKLREKSGVQAKS